MMDESEPEKPKIHFKSIKKKRPIRKKDSSDEEESIEAVDKDAFEEILEIQKLRKRSKGVSAITLASGKKVSKVEELIDSDPFKLKSGGLLTLDKARKAAEIDDEEREMELENQFSKETRVRDEDGEMQKFIETEMEKRTGKGQDSDANEPVQYMPPEEMALLSLPEPLKIKSKQNEEMLSSQMLSGIPEIDLGIDEKIRNIEATENAKKKLAQDRNKKKDKASEFVVTNLAVNFKLGPNRFKTEISEVESNDRKTEKTITTQRTVVVGQVPEERIIEEGGKDNDPTKATDDMHLTKFRKQFQRK